MSYECYSVRPPAMFGCATDDRQTFYDSCEHHFEIRVKVWRSTGGKQYQEQCVYCGVRGRIFKQTQLAQSQKDGAVLFDEELAAEQAEQEEAFVKARGHYRNATPIDEWWAWYDEYGKSEIWQNKRRLVIQRCGNVCEGCRSAPVNHIHHLNYEHVGQEPLYELVGLCKPCHLKVETLKRRDKANTQNRMGVKP